MVDPHAFQVQERGEARSAASHPHSVGDWSEVIHPVMFDVGQEGCPVAWVMQRLQEGTGLVAGLPFAILASRTDRL
jgi:hypothetical protein